MEKELTWQEIERQYNQEWVELIDYEWPEGSPYPSSGVVRVHDADRKRFHAMVKAQPPAGSALVFAGVPARSEGVVHNNLCRVSVCK